MPQEKQTTAVQWLYEQSQLTGMLTKAQVEKAEEIFRQQIEDAYKAFYSPSSDKFGVAEYLKSKEYFESTFTQQQ